MSTHHVPSAVDKNLFSGPWRILIVLLVIASATFAGYQQVFSTFVDYDDEGYVMMSLHNYMSGRALYDDIYTQYGPAFFQIHSAVHQFFNLPVTHDVIRTKALVQWLAICLLGMLTIYRLTRSLSLSITGFVALFCLLERFCVEPGHPQDLGAIGVAALLWLSTCVRHDVRSQWLTKNNMLFIVFAVIVAVVGLTKANIGVLLLAGTALTLFAAAPQKNWLGELTPRIMLLGLAVPVLLIARYWSIQEAILAPLVAAASIGLTLAVAKKAQVNGFSTVQGLIAFVISLLLTAATVLLLTLITGTSVQGLVEGVFLQHLGFAGLLFSPPPVTALIIPATIASGLLVLLFLRGLTSVLTLLRICCLFIGSVLLVQFFVETASPSAGGYEGRMHVKTLTSFAPLLAWVILFPSAGFKSAIRSQVDRYAFARLALCLVAGFQLLISYPIPGSQIAMGSFPLVIILMIGVGDFFKTDLPHLLPSLQFGRKRIAICGTLVVLSIATLVYRDLSLWQRRMSFEPLALPGASLVRLPAEKVGTYHALTSFLKENADTFIFRESTQNCLYFWSGIEPPSGINATIWPHMLNDRLQQKTVNQLQKFDRVIVLSNYSSTPMPDADAPLASYIASNFSMADQIGGFEIWTRKKTQPGGLTVQ